MASRASDPTEEAGSRPTEAVAVADKTDVRSFLRVGLRDLSEEDMSTNATRRFLMYEIQRLNDENGGLRDVQTRYHALCEETATLRERSTKSTRFEVLSFFATTAGAAGLGAAPSFVAVPQLAGVGWVIAIGAAILLIGSVLARMVR